jgi:outer membrane protein assembly factor BamB
MSAAPVALTAWIVWLLVAKRLAPTWRRTGSLVVVVLAFGYFTLIRLDGLDGDLRADVKWRWAPTAEDLARADKQNTPSADSLPEWNAVASPGDWPNFRGLRQNGVAAGRIATDWTSNPPRQVWRRPVGPGWSSMAVVNGRLFTQEQLDDQEMVVCYYAATGKPLWTHKDKARFYHSVSGPGPLATPTFAGGRLFTLGATGVLNCLDAATGQRHWTVRLADDVAAKPPMWGFSGSPLVVDGRVIVFAGGDGDQDLVAYDVQTGKRLWSAAAGKNSYRSPLLATLAGKKQRLILTDGGLTSVDPASGAVLWKAGGAMSGAPRTVMPFVLDSTRLFAGTIEGPGVCLLEVGRKGDTWKVETSWESSGLNPEFPDFVVHKGHAYGFDGATFCCVELGEGNRRWRKGRYGRGQVVLLAEQELLVVTEKGEMILVPANPNGHEELDRFQALNSKTWAPPVVVNGQVYLRNGKEMVCYDLKPQPRPR